MEPLIIDIECMQDAAEIIQQERPYIQEALNNPFPSMRSHVKRSLYKFIRYFWPEYTANKPFQSNWHIKNLSLELEALAYRVANRQPKRYDVLLINVPPGTTKTALVSIMFPLWCWVNWYWMRFITGSYTLPLALESAETARDILKADRMQALFPELAVREDKDNKSNYMIIKKEWRRPGSKPRIYKGGNRFSTSIGGSVTGFHGDINIMDDPLDPERSYSDLELKKANRFMDSTFPYRVTEQSISPTILIMQRLHQNDPSGHLLENSELRIRHICLPGEIENFEKKVKPQEWKQYYMNKLLEPNRLGWNELNKLHSRGEHYYSGQIGQRPTPPGGGMFQVDKIPVVDKMPSSPNVLDVVRYWDKASSEGTGAFTVGLKLYRLKGGKYLVADIVRGQWSTDKREDIIRVTAEADGKEVKQWFEEEGGAGGKDSARFTVKNLDGFSARTDKPRGTKSNRADPVSTQINWGNVMILRADWNKAFRDELEYFPYGTYKDQVDALSGAHGIITGRKRVKVLDR